MTAKQLIKVLSGMDENKVVILTQPSGMGWSNIGKIEETESSISLMDEVYGIFHDS